MMPASPRSPSLRPSRRGSVYVLVLISALMVTVIGLASLSVGQIKIRSTAGRDDWARAQFVAMSGLDAALLLVDEAIETEREGGAVWRGRFTSGLRSPPVPLDEGSYTWLVEDATGDDDLEDDPSEPVRVVATGTVRDAVYRIGVELEAGPGVVGVDALDSAVHTGGQMDFDGCTIACDRQISANSDVSAGGGAMILPDVVSAGSIAGGTYGGATTEFAPPRVMPDGDPFAYYVSRGTPIDIADLPGSPKQLKRVVLSPSNNPYGAENPEGIYVIDCQGQTIEIKWCRIVGTLVLLDTGSSSMIAREVNWEPAYPNYPALLAEAGELLFEFEDQPLSETDAGGSGQKLNFNPPGTPYQGRTDGAVASDAFQRSYAEFGEFYDPTVHDDEYPSVIAGLVYVDGDVKILAGNPTFEGIVLIEGKLTIDPGPTLEVLYRDTYVKKAPPGFQDASAGLPALVTGSLKQITGAP